MLDIVRLFTNLTNVFNLVTKKLVILFNCFSIYRCLSATGSASVTQTTSLITLQCFSSQLILTNRQICQKTLKQQ